MSPAFAARAGIVPDESDPMTVHVVGERFKSAPGYAQLHVEVGEARAANAPVYDFDRKRFGISVPQIDGLLGMTFLARFNVYVGERRRLSSRPRILD